MIHLINCIWNKKRFDNDFRNDSCARLIVKCFFFDCCFDVECRFDIENELWNYFHRFQLTFWRRKNFFFFLMKIEDVFKFFEIRLMNVENVFCFFSTWFVNVENVFCFFVKWLINVENVFCFFVVCLTNVENVFNFFFACLTNVENAFNCWINFFLSIADSNSFDWRFFELKVVDVVLFCIFANDFLNVLDVNEKFLLDDVTIDWN